MYAPPVWMRWPAPHTWFHCRGFCPPHDAQSKVMPGLADPVAPLARSMHPPFPTFWIGPFDFILGFVSEKESVSDAPLMPGIVLMYHCWVLLEGLHWLSNNCFGLLTPSRQRASPLAFFAGMI